MTLETVLIWIIVGLLSGWLASAVIGGGLGVIGDIVVGIIGAFIGAYVFRAAHWHVPFGGLAGQVFVAFIGAVILLVILRLIWRARAGVRL